LWSRNQLLQISTEFVYFEPHVDAASSDDGMLGKRAPPTPLTHNSKSSSLSSLETDNATAKSDASVMDADVAGLPQPMLSPGNAAPIPALPKQSCKRWPLKLLLSACPRRYLLRKCALELFFDNGKSVFIAFEDSKSAARALTILVDQNHPLFNEVRSMKISKQLQQLRLTDRWRRRELSNFDCADCCFVLLPLMCFTVLSLDVPVQI
jgi:hypothetical protein